MTARVSHKARHPRKNKTQINSNVGLGGALKIGQKVGLDVGLPPVEERRKTIFVPGISGLVAHAVRHKVGGGKAILISRFRRVLDP